MFLTLQPVSPVLLAAGNFDYNLFSELLIVAAAANRNVGGEVKTTDTSSAARLRVLIVGPASKANAGLAEWLSEVNGVVVIGTETMTDQALVTAETLKPDVVLLDFETNGLAFFNSIFLFGEVKPSPDIIVLAQKPTPLVRRHCEELGATFVFEKTANLEVLSDTLAALCVGGKSG